MRRQVDTGQRVGSQSTRKETPAHNAHYILLSHGGAKPLEEAIHPDYSGLPAK